MFGEDDLRERLEKPYKKLAKNADFLDDDMKEQFVHGLLDVTAGAAALLEAVIVSVTPSAASGFIDDALSFNA